MPNRIVLRGAALLSLIGAAACTDHAAKVLGPRPTNGIFDSYVALGNSITAGYQSGGINDSTQKLSYAVLLAAQMGTRFAIPSLTMPGCPPPIASFTTQARVTLPGTSPTCNVRTSASATDIINNVAVP